MDALLAQPEHPLLTKHHLHWLASLMAIVAEVPLFRLIAWLMLLPRTRAQKGTLLHTACQCLAPSWRPCCSILTSWGAYWHICIVQMPQGCAPDAFTSQIPYVVAFCMSCAIHFAGSQDTCLRAAVSSLQDHWITDEGK